MRFGTDEQKKRFLPKIQAGELLIAIGYSEPEAGTDLASLKTRAVRDGSEWVINGQKTFTSLADHCDYVWLAARTDPTASKHRGISMFMVPARRARREDHADLDDGRRAHERDLLRGRARAARRTWSAARTRAGALITNQLNHERVSLVQLRSDVRDLRATSCAGRRRRRARRAAA